MKTRIQFVSLKPDRTEAGTFWNRNGAIVAQGTARRLVMAKEVDGECCPYCGSKTGYFYSRRLIEERNGSWGEPSGHGDFDLVRGSVPKTAKCMDCLRRVDRVTAEGGPEDDLH